MQSVAKHLIQQNKFVMQSASEASYSANKFVMQSVAKHLIQQNKFVMQRVAKHLIQQMKNETLQLYTYALTNTSRKVLYIGVTNDLERRLFEHYQGKIMGTTLQESTSVTILFGLKDTNTFNMLLKGKKN